MVQNSYDLIPYESHAFPQTHPDRLATVATLLGTRPKPVAHCRVLELGCASGGNLIPMAASLTTSEFMGIDLSSRQVSDGNRTITDLGLKNIVLKNLNIMDIGPDIGTFDYIICHGVFSWVTTEIQEKLFDVCKQNLNPTGIAYVSYNTYPGWHMRGMIRDIMCYHANQYSDLHLRVKQARNLLDFLANTLSSENSPYSNLLRQELEIIRNAKESYLFHDHLEEVNDPVYFYQFIKRAEARGLRYLGEVDLSVMMPANYPSEVTSVLRMLSPDIIHMEQYMDFLRNRMFRQTLLCHSQVVPTYSISPQRLYPLHVASRLRPAANRPDTLSTEFECFELTAGVGLKTCDPFAKIAMSYLAEIWPRFIRFDELLRISRERLCSLSGKQFEATADQSQLLAACLMSGYTSNAHLVDLSSRPPNIVTAISDRPIVPPFVRMQAARGNQVTNLRHETIVLDQVTRHIVQNLDGTNDRNALRIVLTALVSNGELQVEQDGEPVSDAEKLAELAEATIDKQLDQLARLSILTG